MRLDPRLHDYQVRAVEHLRSSDRGAALFLDMGLGKTATVLQALQPRHLPALVLAPKRVAETVWAEEAARWRPDLRLAQATGTPRQRERARQGAYDVLVMSRDTVTDLHPTKDRYTTVVLDELSGYKTKSTKRWRFTRRLTRDAKHVWGLTGTPAPNGYTDLWAQIFLLDNGARLEKTLTAYRDRYFDEGRRLPSTNVVTEWTAKPGAEDSINALLDDLCLSMSADEYLQLPPLLINKVEVPLPAAARRVISELRATAVADLALLGFDGASTITAGTAAALSGRIRQAAAGFEYEDALGSSAAPTVLHTARVDAIADIVAETGSPVLVFYQFVAERDAILRALPEARTISDTNAIRDWNRGRVPVLVAHPKSAGHGLNLQHGGHTIVWSSLPWSLEEWQQSNKRLHRQNQKSPVVVHVLLSPGTVDSQVYKALESKASVQDALLSYLTVDERMLR